MSLIPWRKHVPETRRPASLFEHFFEEPFLERVPEAFRGATFPPMNVSEDENSFMVAVEAPGLEEKDFDIQIMGNQLQVSGERKMEEEKKEKDFHRIESHYGSFSRTIPLPNALKTDSADAVYKNGMLTVTIPKVEPTPTSKINVKSG